MSYWNTDWTCQNCQHRALISYTHKFCPQCSQRRPHPTKAEAGPTDITQEMIKEIEHVNKSCSDIKYDSGRNLYYFTVNKK